MLHIIYPGWYQQERSEYNERRHTYINIKERLGKNPEKQNSISQWNG